MRNSWNLTCTYRSRSKAILKTRRASKNIMFSGNSPKYDINKNVYNLHDVSEKNMYLTIVPNEQSTEKEVNVVNVVAETSTYGNTSNQLDTIPRLSWFTSDDYRTKKVLLQIEQSLLSDCAYFKKVLVNKLWKDDYDYVRSRRFLGNGLPLEKFDAAALQIPKFKKKIANVFFMDSTPNEKAMKEFLKKMEKWFRLRYSLLKIKPKRRNQARHVVPKARDLTTLAIYNAAVEDADPYHDGMDTALVKYRNGKKRDYMACGFSESVFPKLKSVCQSTEVTKVFDIFHSDFSLSQTNENSSQFQQLGKLEITNEKELLSNEADKIDETLKEYNVEHDYCRLSSALPSTSSLDTKEWYENDATPDRSTNYTMSCENEPDHEYLDKVDENVEIELCDLCLELETLAIDSSASVSLQIENQCDGECEASDTQNECVVDESPELYFSDSQCQLHFQTYKADEECFSLQYYYKEFYSHNSTAKPMPLPDELFLEEEQRCQCLLCHDNYVKLKQNWESLIMYAGNRTENPQITEYSLRDDADGTINILLENVETNAILLVDSERNGVHIAEVKGYAEDSAVDIAVQKRAATNVLKHELPLKKRKYYVG